ncbi:MAG: response regulator [Planctomycetota bacterium]|jgi:CheY-like chemotaxis protein
MAAPRVLVAEGSDAGRIHIADALTDEGYDVTAAADGRDALEQAKATAPDLMVVALDLPKLNGWKVLKRVRALDGLGGTPVLFIAERASDALERKAAKVGAEDVLFRPVHPETLAFRVARALSRRYKVEQVHRTLKKTADTTRRMNPKTDVAPAVAEPVQAQPATDPPALAGSLAHITLPTVLTMLEVEHKTGRLTIVNGHDGSAGWCELRNGRVMRAVLDGMETFANREAVLRMLTWADGAFRFQVEPVDAADEVGAATTELLIDGARFADESGVFESPF